MSAEKIGGILAKLAGEQGPYLENDRCPGALLRLTRIEADQMQRHEVEFVENVRAMPPEGRHSMRVRCNGQVMAVQKSQDLNRGQSEEANRVYWTVTYGLCARCNGYELAMRQRLKQAAEMAASNQRATKKFGEAAE